MRTFVVAVLLACATPAFPCSIEEPEDQAPEAWQALPRHLEAIKEPRLWLVRFGKRTAMKKDGRHQTYEVEVVDTIRGAAPAKKELELTVDMSHPCGDEASTEIDRGSQGVVAHDGKGFARERWHADPKEAWVERLRFLVAKIVDDASYTKKLRATDAAMKAKDYEKVVTALRGFAAKGALDARRLDRLGLALGKLGRYGEAASELEDARMLTRLTFKTDRPKDPTLFFRIRFNLLCYLSLAGRSDSSEARWVLADFVELLKGSPKAERDRWTKALKTDPDLTALRKTKEFAAALKK